MVEAADWPNKYPAGTAAWFEAMMKRMAEIGGEDVSARDLAKYVRTEEEADLLLEMMRRTRAHKV